MPEQGIVKWYSLARGYGFIRREGGDGQDVFVHHTEVPGEPLVEGERVDFEIVDGPKGVMARNLKRLSRDGEPAAANA